jgi:hypothetical protein
MSFFASLRYPLAFYIHLLRIQIYSYKANHSTDIILRTVMIISSVDFPTEYLTSHISHVTCLANLILLDLITIMIFH